jgi:flavin-dependent dehydrogenase
MSSANHYDLIIVGAGPAGISTALHLANLAPDLVSRTLLLEKEHHPRPKLCGGGLLADAEVILRQLGLDVTEIPHVDVDWARFDYDGRGFKMRSDPRRPFAFRVIRRHEFDAWLANKAREKGIEIREGVTVKAVLPGKDEVSLETNAGRFTARVVVGADGSKGVARRAVVPREKVHSAKLLEIVTEPRAEQSFHIQTDSYFDFLYAPQGVLGYTWDFPALENGQPVRVRGIFDSNVYKHRSSVTLTQALADELRHHGYDLDEYKLEGHPLRWFEASSLFSVPHILLVGDAAGADALFGEGISLALGYGQLAAPAIRDAFARQDFSFSGYKACLLRSEMGKALRRRTWLAKFFYYLRSRTIQRVVWRHLGPVVTWIMQTFIIGWAARQEKRKV